MNKKSFIYLTTMMALAANAQQPSITPAASGNRITEFTVDYAGNQKGETMLWQAANYDVDQDYSQVGVWGDCSPVVVANPDKTGINSNDKCLKLTVGADGKCIFKMPISVDLKGRRRLSLLYKPASGSDRFNAELELVNDDNASGDNYELKLGAWYDGGGGWKRMYFNFEPYNEANATHPVAISDNPNVLVFYAKTRAQVDDNDYAEVGYNVGDEFYIDEIKVEDEPYANGVWIDSFSEGWSQRWNKAYDPATAVQAFPSDDTNGVVYLSGTWLKGHNIVNPEIQEEDTESGKVKRWVYEYNEYRDVTWHVNPDKIKYYVVQKGSTLRQPDRGAIVGTSTDKEQKSVDEGGYGYPHLFIPNTNVLVFAEDTEEESGRWYETNVAFYKDGKWEAMELELSDSYSFVNPVAFTSKERVKVHRSMVQGFNTILYPFSLTASEICSSRVGTFYHHNDEDIVYFVPTAETTANVPFVTENFTPTLVEGVTNVTDVYQEFPGEKEISVADPTVTYKSSAAYGNSDYHVDQQDNAGYYLVGTYSRISGAGKWGIATMEDGTQSLKRGGANSSFRPFRAYLDMGDASQPSKFTELSILEMKEETPIDDETPANETTSVSSPEIISTGVGEIYSLCGVKVKSSSMAHDIHSLPKGIYIINNRKILIK